MYSSGYVMCIASKLSNNCSKFNIVKPFFFSNSVRQLCLRPNSMNLDPAFTAVVSKLRGESSAFSFQSGHVRGFKSNLDESPCRNLSTTAPVPKPKKEKVTVTFIKKDGTRIEAEGKEGDSLYDIVINNSLDIDGYGACEGTASCSTCHLILKKEDYEKVDDKPSDEEQDLLDLAYDLTDTSRLGCMVHITKALNGLEVYVPEGINDVRAI